MPSHPTSRRFISILYAHLHVGLPSGLFLQVSQPKPSIHFFCVPYVQHMPLISLFFISHTLLPATMSRGTLTQFFPLNQLSEYKVCFIGWCAGCLGVWLVDSVTCWGPLQRGDLLWVQSLLIDFWLFIDEVSNLSLNLLTTQTMVTTGILPPTRKIPMVEPGIEPGTSWLVVRSSDH